MTISIAWMSALIHLSTTLLSFILALLLLTNILILIPNYASTKSALLCIFFSFILCTSFAQMVRLTSTIFAKVIPTLIATDPILTHMLGMGLRKVLSFVIFEVITNFSLKNLYHVSTFALNNI